MICPTSSLVINGEPIKQQRYELDMFVIPNIYHCGSMEFPLIAIDAEREATAIMPWIMIDNTSKAIESQLWLKSKESALHRFCHTVTIPNLSNKNRTFVSSVTQSAVTIVVIQINIARWRRGEKEMGRVF